MNAGKTYIKKSISKSLKKITFEPGKKKRQVNFINREIACNAEIYTKSNILKSHWSSNITLDVLSVR